MEVTPEKLQGACREVLGHSDMVPWTLEKVLDEYAAPLFVEGCPSPSVHVLAR